MGKVVGKVSKDLIVLRVRPGRHVLRIESEVIEPIEMEIELDEGEDVEYTIEAKMKRVKVKIDSESAGAKIYVDGKFVGYTPKHLEMRYGEKVKIELRKEGYKILRDELKVSKVEGIVKLYKLKEVPKILWQKTLGGSDWDLANSVIQAEDGGYIVVGETKSNDGDVEGYYGKSDMWVVKLGYWVF